MLLIEDDVIYLTRGDDAEIEIAITDGDGAAYAMQDGDTLTLTVRSLPDAGSPVVFSVTSDTPRLILSHADTADADVGKYSADVELISGGFRRTVWPTLDEGARGKVRSFKNFVIMPEVTQ